MSRPLQAATIAAPALRGLNTQDSVVNLEDGFALQADNCIIDKFGRLGSRKGWKMRTTATDILSGTVSVTGTEAINQTTINVTTAAGSGVTVVAGDKVTFAGDDNQYVIASTATIGAGTTGDIVLASPGLLKAHAAGDLVASALNILGMHHFIDFTGAKTVISWSATTFYRGVGTMAPLAVLNTTNDETISDGNWMAATLNDLCYFFQEGYLPLVYDPTGAGGAGTLTTLMDFVGVTTGNPSNLPSAGFVMSAFGRIWAVGTTTNKTKIHFSDVNNGLKWNGGTSGSLDIASVFPKGTDVITGLATQNGALVILCKNSIVIYDDQTGGFNGTISVAALTLTDIIYGVGCMAVKTIVNTGEDVLFLDSTGVRSLGRTIQEKSRPMRDVSKNVRDDLILSIANTLDRSEITAIYSPLDAFYLLAFPTLAAGYCFDTKGMLEDGSFRATTWSKIPHSSYSFDPITDVIRIAQVAGIAEYMNYTDDGASYDMKYYTTHFDMGNANAEKILKNMSVTIMGAMGQVFVLKVGTDYSTIYNSYPYTLTVGGAVSEYGTSKYGVAKYAGGVAIENIRAAIGGSARIIQAGMETTINGSLISLQKLDILTKLGRMI